jgi:hypothetical protein
MKEKIGIVFSHIHVRPHEMYKFDMLNYCIDHFRGFDLVLSFVLCGHGEEPPESTRKRIDGIYWETDIDSKEIGRGHPKFCIKGYEILLKNDIQKSLKMRASDILVNEEEITRILVQNKVTVTEQTSIQKGMIGDLFMAGPTKQVLDFWTENDWDYNKSGLYNLFDNATSLASKRNNDVETFLKQEFSFVDPSLIGWMTLDNNWDIDNKQIREPWTNKHFWGHMQGYGYYGGF